jgi:hypothetical protein
VVCSRRYKVPLAAQLAVKALVFGAATLGLFLTGHPALAATIWRGRGFQFGG